MDSSGRPPKTASACGDFGRRVRAPDGDGSSPSWRSSPTPKSTAFAARSTFFDSPVGIYCGANDLQKSNVRLKTPLTELLWRADNPGEGLMRIWISFDWNLLIKNSYYLVLLGYSRRKYHVYQRTRIIAPGARKIKGPFYCTKFILLNFVLAFDTGPRLRKVKRGPETRRDLVGGELPKAPAQGPGGSSPSGLPGRIIQEP